jgi:hypothetical protein
MTRKTTSRGGLLDAILVAVTVVIATTGARPAAAAFENLAVSPRARAMGESAVAAPEAAFAVAHNPAALGDATGGALAATYVRPFGLDFARLAYVSAAIPLPGAPGHLGVAFSNFDVEHEGEDLMAENVVSVGYGVPLFHDLHSTVFLGATTNLYHLDFGATVGDGSPEFTGAFDPGSASALGFDVGLLAVLHERTRFGVLVHNLNSPEIGDDQEPLPRRIHGGAAYEPYPGVVTSFEISAEVDQEAQYHGGLEFELAPGFDVRGGLISNPNKLTAGFGYEIRGIALNYGFSTGGGVLDTTHQFGLTVAWGGAPK